MTAFNEYDTTTVRAASATQTLLRFTVPRHGASDCGRILSLIALFREGAKEASACVAPEPQEVTQQATQSMVVRFVRHFGPPPIRQG